MSNCHVHLNLALVYHVPAHQDSFSLSHTQTVICTIVFQNVSCYSSIKEYLNKIIINIFKIIIYKIFISLYVKTFQKSNGSATMKKIAFMLITLIMSLGM